MATTHDSINVNILKQRKSCLKVKANPSNDREGLDTPAKKRGAKPKTFDSLSPRVKHVRLRNLAKAYGLKALLQAAEMSAKSCGKVETAKVLTNLMNCEEEYATSLLRNPAHPVSVESSLSLKNELYLSKRKYSTLSQFLKSEFGFAVLQPWKSIMEYRNKIIPDYSKPDRSLGFLAVKTTLRKMIENHITRLFESYPSILQQLKCSTVDCSRMTIVLRITGGLDSATGFSQYHQKGLLGEDNSLLV